MHFSMFLGLLAIFILSTSAVYVPLPKPYNDYCVLENNENLYQPERADDVKWFDVNLDDPPKEHFKAISKAYKTEINGLIKVIKDLVVPWFPPILDIIHVLFSQLTRWIPEPYRSEIEGIAEETGLPLGEVVMYNVFYEVFTVCTSIIAQAPNGTLYHARNLDFGLFLGWDPKLHEWSISGVLRKMIVNINWYKNGKLLYKSNNFAGFVGIYNGLKPNAFTITANERFKMAGGYYGMVRYILGLDPDAQWMTWLTRWTMENCETYDEAITMLKTSPILSPVYYIVGGVKPFEGAIITRSLNATDSVVTLDPTSSNGWYLLQTNYDPGTEPFYLDNRDVPGRLCMKLLTQKNVGFQGLFNVLSSRTTLNKLTTYTVLMNSASSEFETHIQYCPGFCWGW